jgi:outer membrane lipoprotein SlyB|tara:strand:+ start:124 stop:504 length:381 start_codon:yes stop_codon:yes gene_type:complete
MKNLLTALFLITLLGCVANNSSSIFEGSKPIIDTKGVNMSQYEIDLEECSIFSEDISTGKSIAKGAVTGAAVGAVIEAITDDVRSRRDAIEVGAVSGGAQSGIRAVREKEQILKRCLRGRGYKVLN